MEGNLVSLANICRTGSGRVKKKAKGGKSEECEVITFFFYFKEEGGKQRVGGEVNKGRQFYSLTI